MSIQWKFVGKSGNNDEVASTLNDNGFGSQVSISLTANRMSFDIWGNHDNKTTKPGYVWKALGEIEKNEPEKVTELLQNKEAAGSAVSVNYNERFVVWGYVAS